MAGHPTSPTAEALEGGVLDEAELLMVLGGEGQDTGDRPPRGGSRLDPRTRLGSVISTLPRTGTFYARSWRRYLRSRSGSDIPVARPTLALAGHALYDEVLMAGFRLITSPGFDRSFRQRVLEETRTAVELFEERGWVRPDRYLASSPPAAEGLTITTEKARSLAYERIVFDSGYEPDVDEPGRARWSGYAANRQVSAWMLRHDEPRPWLVCVHGAAMGRAMIDLPLFHARWLHEDLGLNVLLPVLPLHGPRRRDALGSGFPGVDPLDNVHGAAQAVWDIRRLLAWIRATQDDPQIGISGVSLGGYVTSLVASVDDGLRTAILGVPVSNMADLLEQHPGFSKTDDGREALGLARRLGRAVSPLEGTPRVPVERRFIYAGVADRLVHPRHQVVRLWEHWGRPEISWYPGGHAGFRRSKPVGQFIREALERSSLIEPRAGSERAD